MKVKNKTFYTWLFFGLFFISCQTRKVDLCKIEYKKLSKQELCYKISLLSNNLYGKDDIVVFTNHLKVLNKEDFLNRYDEQYKLKIFTNSYYIETTTHKDGNLFSLTLIAESEYIQFYLTNFKNTKDYILKTNYSIKM